MLANNSESFNAELLTELAPVGKREELLAERIVFLERVLHASHSEPVEDHGLPWWDRLHNFVRGLYQDLDRLQSIRKQRKLEAEDPRR
jgi:hypothetical protein